MTLNRLFIDYELCFGCYACEAACKQENNLPVGPKWIRVITVGPERVNGRLSMDFIPMTCRHCSNAPCIHACPQEAIRRREDGVVLISSELCIGCQECLSACPFGAPQFNAERDVMEKCNLCLPRLECNEMSESCQGRNTRLMRRRGVRCTQRPGRDAEGTSARARQKEPPPPR